MLKRILQLPLDQKNSIFLFGPRGTGKTSWIKKNLKDAVYLDLLEFSLFSLLSADPGKLETLIPPNFSNWIVIDEIQKIPKLLDEVHRLIELKKYRFLLTGSSARTLKRIGVNLLAGRALRYHMYPLIFDELTTDISLEYVLQYGLLPAVITHNDPKRYLQTYVQTYLKEEVQQEGLTRNVGAFSRFLEAASFSQAQVLNVSEIARELGLNRLTVSNYFDILEDLLLSYRIDVFTYKAKRKMIAHQKFFFFDAGVYRIIRPSGPLDRKEESEGVALETLFLQSVLAINDYYNLGYKVYYWRTMLGQEVDFVLYGERGFHAFEIKRATVVTSLMLKGLRVFKEDYPEVKAHFLFLGQMKQYYGDITVIPFKDALVGLYELIKGT